MDYLKVPKTNFKFSRIGFGCEQLGLHNWGNISIRDIEIAVNQAIDIGINYFDTADIYGLGKSEENLSKFLGSRRKEIHIISKFGIRFKDGKKIIDNTPDWIKFSVESSLKRLKTDVIDIYQLHYWDEKTNFDCIIEVIENLIQEGKVKAFSFSNVAFDSIEKFKILKKYSSTFSYEFSLAKNDYHQSIIKLSSDMLFLAYGALGQGILSGKYNQNSFFAKDDRRSELRYSNFHGEKLKKNLLIVSYLNEISNRLKVPISAVALRYILEVVPNSSIILGIKNPEQLKNNLKIFQISLLPEEIKQLNILSYAKN